MFNKPKPLWRSSVSMVLIYAVFAALLLAFEKAVDSIVSNKFVAGVDAFTAASSYIVVGGWFGVLITLILALLFGNILGVFKPINLMQKRMYKPTIAAGIAAAVSTFVFLFGLQIIDLQLIYALTSSYLLFVMIWEAISGKIEFRSFAVPGILIILGSVVASYAPTMLVNKQGLSPELFVVACLGIFVLYNAAFATDELLHKPAIQAADHPMNVQILRFITLAVTASVTVTLIAIARGKVDLLIGACGFLIGNPDARLWLFVLFVLATFGMLARLIAKDKSDSVSKVVLVVAGNLAIGLPLSLLLNLIWPGAAGAVPKSPEIVAVRIVGSVIIAIGILMLIRKHRD